MVGLQVWIAYKILNMGNSQESRPSLPLFLSPRTENNTGVRSPAFHGFQKAERKPRTVGPGRSSNHRPSNKKDHRWICQGLNTMCRLCLFLRQLAPEEDNSEHAFVYSNFNLYVQVPEKLDRHRHGGLRPSSIKCCETTT